MSANFIDAFTPLWIKAFTERQVKEINFSMVYAQDFNHGTDGHNAKLIIAKMVEILNGLEQGKTVNQMVGENET